MLEIGKFTTLTVDRIKSPGAYLINDNDDDILLPNKYVDNDLKVGDEIEVFIYLDGEERLVATTIKPYIKLNDFAALKANNVNKIGAFMDWGLEKDLFIPFREQERKIKEGYTYLVYMYFDHQTERLVGSTKIAKYLDNTNHGLQVRDKVHLIVWQSSDLGTKVIINKKHLGLLYSNEVFKNLKLGEVTTGFIKKTRSDDKIDVSLEEISYKNIEPNAQKILTLLEKNKGFLNLNDKSHPDEIQSMLGISKKAFKKSLGALYKKRLVTIDRKGIHLK
ncbi:MAG: S1 RNA-binding domain-containing protein [Parvicellaceae bacterium]